ncbi:ribonuclease H-like domain-containing protein, partial [Tanacetum coccineum]
FAPKKKKQIFASDIAEKLVRSTRVDFMFKVNFLMLFANVMGKSDTMRAFVNLSVVRRIREDTNIARVDCCPQLDHEDLEQLNEFDLEEMDLKWQVAMISMRLKKFHNKSGRKIAFDAKELVGFDKTKVECYNCHKTGHFPRECKSKKNQDSKRKDAWKAKDTGRRSGNQEESNALMTLDGEGIDWTAHAYDEEDNFALMAFSNSNLDTEVTSYSNECIESYVNLKKLYDEQKEQLGIASIEIQAYEKALKQVEAQLVAYQKSQLWYEEKIRYMTVDLDDKTNLLTYHKKLLDEAQKEKEELSATRVASKTNLESQPKVWTDAPIIEEYESDSDDDCVSTPSKEQKQPSFAFVNTDKHDDPHKALKAQVRRLKKQTKPFIRHHKAWQMAVMIKKQQKHKPLKSSKKRKDVSIQGRKSAKAQPFVPKDTTFDDLEGFDGLDHMETKDYNEGGVSTEAKVSTDKPKVSTDKPEVSTDKPQVSTVSTNVSTDKDKEGTDEPTTTPEAPTTTPTAQTPTPTTFGDDQTIAQVLLNMSQAKAVSKEKEKGVEIKDVERQRVSSTRSVLTLQLLPKIDPKDKGKKRIEKDDESGTESDEISTAEKKFKQLAHDEEIARKMQEDWEAEEEKKRLAEKEATNAALIHEFDDIKARIEADRLLALRLQEEERAVYNRRERKIPS